MGTLAFFFANECARWDCAKGRLLGVQVEQLADPALPVSDIVAKCPAQQLMAVYKIPTFSGVDQFLQLVAAARGKLAKVRNKMNKSN